MLRAMYSGIAGMRGFQTKLDVIGNNIANVNTTGFKAGRVMFKDMLSQTVGGAARPGANIGGINPRQIGLGSTISAIDTLHTQGSAQTTNVPTDMMVNGEGFFVLSNDGGSTLYYTRAGNFSWDGGTGGSPNLKSLVAPNGMKVQGIAVDANGNPINNVVTDIRIPDDAQSFSIDDKGIVSYVDASGNKQYVAAIRIAKFANPGGLLKTGDNLYTSTANSGADNPAQWTDAVAGQKGRGMLIVGALEMSNVDLSNEFAEMIVAQRGFQANTRIITTSDEILQELVNLKR
ncbi:flagellar basal body rod protein FlgG [Effusibacillus pohliae]|uniref:flagellar basal body rod protein FlgG n=1 Tax=Effusibacillus pohliae TaxID=232270 RepID=UPI00037AC1E6|nr:flagellar basal body rod protein FlgG [Effusibacillus pohliae]